MEGHITESADERDGGAPAAAAGAGRFGCVGAIDALRDRGAHE